MGFVEKVKDSLERLNLPGAEIDIHFNGYSMLVDLVSDHFQGMEEDERQEMVWGQLLADLTDDEIKRVEFVFTDTRAELEAVPEDE